MRRYLLVALWPAGMAAIAAATVIAARRAPAPRALARAPAGDPAGKADAAEPAAADHGGRDGVKLAGVADATDHGSARPASASARIPEAFRSLSDRPRA